MHNQQLKDSIVGQMMVIIVLKMVCQDVIHLSEYVLQQMEYFVSLLIIKLA